MPAAWEDPVLNTVKLSAMFSLASGCGRKRPQLFYAALLLHDVLAIGALTTRTHLTSGPRMDVKQGHVVIHICESRKAEKHCRMLHAHAIQLPGSLQAHSLVTTNSAHWKNICGVAACTEFSASLGPLHKTEFET